MTEDHQAANLKPYYQDDLTTIYHGDCAEIAPQLGRFDLLLTDPPYGIKGGDAGTGWRANHKQVKWDDAPPDISLLLALCQQAKYQIVWGGNYFYMPPQRCWLVWDKNNGTNALSDCELAWTNLTGSIRKFTWHHFQGERIKAQHPTQKPLPLMHWCLNFAPDAKTVIDPFMGSGTTLLACKQKGIASVGIEREEKYCEAAATRLSQLVLSFET